MKIALNILLEQDHPEDLRGDKQPLEERVAEWIEDVELGANSAECSWRKLSKLFNCLASKSNLSDRGIALLKLIEPLMQKYGIMEGVKLESSYPYQLHPSFLREEEK